MRTRVWAAGAAIGFGILVIGTGVVVREWRLAWRPPVYHMQEPPALAGALRSWEEHNAIRRAQPEPYVLELEGPGALLYFGTGHTRDPESAFVRGIVERWERFAPTVALCEGRTRFFFFGHDSGVRRFGEAATLVHLSRRDGVPLYSLEPAYEDEVREMLEEWDPARVAAFYTLRVFWGEKPGHEAGAIDALASHLLSKRTNVAGLRGSIESLAELDALWREWLPDAPDWRTLDAEPRASFLADIADRSREIRADHMVRTLVDLCRRGERVFAVVGSGHVIRQEPMIRVTLGAE